MFSFRTTGLLDQEDLVLKSGRLGLVCNDLAWYPDRGEYLYETLSRERRLSTVFHTGNPFPCTDVFEHSISVRDAGSILSGECRGEIENIDALIIDIQDTGIRYHANTEILFGILKKVSEYGMNIPVYIIDRMNPAGRQVEGTPLKKAFETGSCMEGLPHRHGLTAGELANMFHIETGAGFPLHVISYMAPGSNRELMPWSIPPSTDFHGLFTSAMYCGQYLWKATNVSCGEGTGRDYEYFGAPFMKILQEFNGKNGNKGWNSTDNPLCDDGVYLRWTCFVPEYGRYCGERCFGFQLLPKPDAPYHSLAHNLKIIRFIRENLADFRFLEEQTETGYRLIDILAGDETVTGYLEGNTGWTDMREHIKSEEQKWMRKAKKYLLYGESPWRVKQL